MFLLLSKDDEHLKEYLLTTCVSSFENYLLSTLSHVLIGRFICLVLIICSYLYILVTDPLSGV